MRAVNRQHPTKPKSPDAISANGNPHPRICQHGDDFIGNISEHPLE
jgi:hypothetical protein